MPISSSSQNFPSYDPNTHLIKNEAEVSQKKEIEQNSFLTRAVHWLKGSFKAKKTAIAVDHYISDPSNVQKNSKMDFSHPLYQGEMDDLEGLIKKGSSSKQLSAVIRSSLSPKEFQPLSDRFSEFPMEVIFSILSQIDKPEDQRNIIQLSREFSLIGDESFKKDIFSNQRLAIAAKIGSVQTIKKLLKNEELDFSKDNNQAIINASQNGHAEVVKALLEDKRVDPTANNQEAIRLASLNGHAEVVKALLEDERVDPAANNQKAFWSAISKAHEEVIKVFLKDGRGVPINKAASIINMTVLNGHADVLRILLQDKRIATIDDWAIEDAVKQGYVDVLEVLLQDGRADPSTHNNGALRIASYKGNLKMVKLLLKDGRVDPTANKNQAIKWANEEGHKAIVEELLKDDRVRASWTPGR